MEFHVRTPKKKPVWNSRNWVRLINQPIIGSTLCGAPCTDHDAALKDVITKKFQKTYEAFSKETGHTICRKCLTMAKERNEQNV